MCAFLTKINNSFSHLKLDHLDELSSYVRRKLQHTFLSAIKHADCSICLYNHFSFLRLQMHAFSRTVSSIKAISSLSDPMRNTHSYLLSVNTYIDKTHTPCTDFSNQLPSPARDCFDYHVKPRPICWKPTAAYVGNLQLIM